MKLHVRLALPLFVFAATVSIASTIGVILLVRRTAAAAVEQNRRQFERIISHQLIARARDLNDVAAILASLDGSARSRMGAWSHIPLDAAVILDRTTGRILSVAGATPDRADLDAVLHGVAADPVILHDDDGLFVAAARPSAQGRQIAVAAQRLGPEFARAIKDLLQGEITLVIAAKTVTTTSAPVPPDTPAGRGASPSAATDWFDVEIPLRTAGFTPARLIVTVPAAEFHAARRAALQLAALGGLLLLGTAVLFSRYTMARVTRPIGDLIAATDRIAAGSLDPGLPPDAPAELGSLMRQFNAMATALRDTQDKLVHSAKLSSVGQLVASVSHELNNPLSGLLSHAEYLGSRLPVGAPGRAEVEVIIEEGARMKRILGELRGFIRPGATERVRMDLNAVATDVLALIQHDADRTKVTCERAFGADDMTIMASPDQIRQAVLNLALNALQAMPDGGVLRLTTTAYRGASASPAIELILEDTGIGIPPEHATRILEPFFSTKPGRLGLGLAIVQETAVKHGGRLGLAPRPGGGTRVVLAFPRATS